MGLNADMIHRGGRPRMKRMAINDPLSDGPHAEKKAALVDYARNEMRVNGDIRIPDPMEEERLEPWQKRRRFG